jgi:phosphoribosylanthranilate isomerase
MLERQLAQATTKAELKKLVENMPPKLVQIKIYHREDHYIKQLLQETRINKALELSNSLLRLANKSSTPPQALYNLPVNQFFT